MIVSVSVAPTSATTNAALAKGFPAAPFAKACAAKVFMMRGRAESVTVTVAGAEVVLA